MPKEVNREKSLKEAEASKNYQTARALLKDKGKLLDTVMQAIGDGLVLLDRDLRIVYQNKSMEDMFGDHIGEYYHTLYEGKKVPTQSAFETGEVSRALLMGITKEGEHLRFENIASVLKDAKGNIVAGLELVRLVEERETAFEDLKAKTVELEEFQKLAAGRESRLTELENTIKEQTQAIESLKTRLIAEGKSM